MRLETTMYTVVNKLYQHFYITYSNNSLKKELRYFKHKKVKWKS